MGKDNHTTESYEPEHDASMLKKKIHFLEEELMRKEKIIEHLRSENEILFKTALKRSENKVDSLK